MEKMPAFLAVMGIFRGNRTGNQGIDLCQQRRRTQARVPPQRSEVRRQGFLRVRGGFILFLPLEKCGREL